jgi:hypothetical protein
MTVKLPEQKRTRPFHCHPVYCSWVDCKHRKLGRHCPEATGWSLPYIAFKPVLLGEKK